MEYEMPNSEYDIKDEELGEPGISLTTMWFLLAIVISFAAGLVIFGYSEPQPAALVQYMGDLELGSSMMTVQSCEEKLTQIRENKKTYAANHPDDPINNLQSFCIK